MSASAFSVRHGRHRNRGRLNYVTLCWKAYFSQRNLGGLLPGFRTPLKKPGGIWAKPNDNCYTPKNTLRY
jgi:hypothetical protein